MESLVTYLLAAMFAWVPAYAQPKSELPADVQARYESIARDLSSVVLDESERPLFDGPDARTKTAMLMLSIASFESAFRKTVDNGELRGDHGHSYCLMQMRVGSGATPEGWTGPQLVEDRKLCFKAALHLLRKSFAICHSYPVEDRIAVYATGHCMLEASISRSRVGRARRWWEGHALPAVTPNSPSGDEVVRVTAPPSDSPLSPTPTGS